MNEIKNSDIDFILNALTQYLEHMKKVRNVDLQEFKNFMEPHFTAAGYRSPIGGGYNSCNILIIHDAGAGDFIAQSGAIREIRRLYPTATITLVVSPNGYQLAECCPYVDEVYCAARPWNLNQYFEQGFEWDMNFARLLLEKRFDICYSFVGMPATPPLMYMSGAKVRISWELLKENAMENTDVPARYGVQNLATHIVPPLEFGKHAVDLAFSLIDNFLHMPVANRELEVWYMPAELAIAKSIVRNLQHPFYALMMGASDPKRHYPVEKYAELVKMILAEEPTAMFINFGGGQNDEISAQILQQKLGEEIFNRHVVNLVNKTNFRIDAAVMNFCDMYIGNNTGNSMLASAVKCPTLVVECFAKDLDSGYSDVPRSCGPYRVPGVSVQPKHALPGCAINKPYNPFGCRFTKPHCITQVAPETLFRGFKLLKEKIAKQIIDTTYIC